jgi:hypothetical protein
MGHGSTRKRTDRSGHHENWTLRAGANLMLLTNKSNKVEATGYSRLVRNDPCSSVASCLRIDYGARQTVTLSGIRTSSTLPSSSR